MIFQSIGCHNSKRVRSPGLVMHGIIVLDVLHSENRSGPPAIQLWLKSGLGICLGHLCLGLADDVLRKIHDRRSLQGVEAVHQPLPVDLVVERRLVALALVLALLDHGRAPMIKVLHIGGEMDLHLARPLFELRLEHLSLPLVEHLAQLCQFDLELLDLGVLHVFLCRRGTLRFLGRFLLACRFIRGSRARRSGVGVANRLRLVLGEIPVVVDGLVDGLFACPDLCQRSEDLVLHQHVELLQRHGDLPGHGCGRRAYLRAASGELQPRALRASAMSELGWLPG